jgi:hypothetical protein
MRSVEATMSRKVPSTIRRAVTALALIPTFAVLAAVAGTACSDRVTESRGDTLSDISRTGGDDAEEELVTVRGTLTDEGVECQALRTAEGELYTLTGDLGGFETGAVVEVEGRIARFSICMQGTTLTVESIESVDGEPESQALSRSRRSG